MDFVDDEDFDARFHRAESRRLDDFAHVIDAGAAGGVHLDDVRMSVRHDRTAIGADAAGIRGGAALSVRGRCS